MDRTVARLNIAHYKQLLETEIDDVKRQTLTRLLAEEEAKLRKLSESDPHQKHG
jgi:hypothetical protein